MPLFNAEATLFTMHEGAAVNKALDKFQQREMSRAVKAFLMACLPKIPVRTGFLRGAFKPMKQMYATAGGTELDPGFVLKAAEEGKGRFKPAELLNALFSDRELAKRLFEESRGFDPKGRPLRKDQQEARHRQFEREQKERLRRYRRNKAMERRLKDLRHTEYYYYSKKTRVIKNVTNAVKFVHPSDPAEVIKKSGMVSTIQFDVRIIYYRINDNYSRITGAPWRSMEAGFMAVLNYLEKAMYRFPLFSELLVVQKLALKGSQVTKTSGFESSYRGRFTGTDDLSGAGAIQGAKMDDYPSSMTKTPMPGMPAPTTKIHTQRERLLKERKRKRKK